MLRQNRSCSVLATAKSRYHFGTKLYQTDKCNKTRRIVTGSNLDNKRGYSAEGYSLLTSALRPRLFGGSKNGKFLDLVKLLKTRLNYTKNTISANSLLQSVKNNIYAKESSQFYRAILSFSLFLVSITIVSIFSLFQNNANASAFSLTLTVPSDISLDLNLNTNNGFGEKTSDELKVKTTSPAGYKLQLGAKGNGTNDLVNTTSSNSKLTSITANTTADNFKNSGVVNTWGYKPSKLNGSANTNYIKAPSGSTPDTLDTTNSANSSDNNYSLAIAAKVNSNTVAGNYTNTFVLTATANTLSYNITYNLNSGTWSGTSPQTGNTTSETVTLDSHSPSKSGYTFKGWCSSSSITNNNTTNTPSCGGTTYQPSGTYTLTGATNNLTLYAMWQQDVIYRSYTINYYGSIGSPSSMPSSQSGSAASTNGYQVILRSNTPILSDYIFQGWCTSSSITNNGTPNTPTCSSSKYQPSDSITISSNSQTVSLYAMWKLNGPISCSASNKIPASPNRSFGGKTWTTTPAQCTWYDAKNACPAGYHLPTRDEFSALLNSVGTGSQLSSQGWHDCGVSNDEYCCFWSSSESNNRGFRLAVKGTQANLGTSTGTKSSKYGVRCVSG